MRKLKHTQTEPASQSVEEKDIVITLQIQKIVDVPCSNKRSFDGLVVFTHWKYVYNKAAVERWLICIQSVKSTNGIILWSLKCAGSSGG